MTMHYETSARKLHCADAALQEPDVINYSDVHRHNSRKIIAFTAPAAVPHPSMRSRHRRMARRQALQYKLLVTLPAARVFFFWPCFSICGWLFFPQMRRPDSRRCGAAPICWPLSAS